MEESGALTCTTCHQTPEIKRPEEPAERPPAASVLARYDNAEWSCDSCGIPVNALDLIEGRASKTGGRMVCSRCAGSVGARQEAISDEKAPPKRSLPTPAALTGSGRAMAMPRKSVSNEASFTAKAEAESKRPMLPIVLFAIILPMFAVSLYFAVMSQQKLNEMQLENASAEKADDSTERRRPAPEPLIPDNRGSIQPDNKEEPDPQPEVPRATSAKDNPINASAVKDLAEIEQDMARPVNALLESDDLADVWEGLVQAGSQRLIACRPWVRRLLSDQDDKTRALSAHVCGLLEDDDALPILDTMVDKDPSGQVRMQARKARSRLTGQATRELSDFSTEELENLLQELKEELSRRKPSDD
ncbi:MAG: HEAT repeat domain-containing protein [Planctomycetota bacterium]